MRYLAYFLLFITVRRYDFKERSALKKFIFLSLIILSFIYGALTIYYGISGTKNVSADILNYFFASTGHNHIAGLLMLSVPVTIAVIVDLMRVKKKLWIRLCGLSIGVQFIALILSYSRSSYVLILLYLAVFFFLKRSTLNKRWTFAFVALFAVIFCLFQFIYFYSFSKNPLMLDNHLFKSIRSPEFRFEYINQAIQGVKMSPLFGTGLDTFIYVSRKFKSSDHGYVTSANAHNYFVQMGTETGLLGGGLFVIFIAYCLVRIFFNLRSKANFFEYSLFVALIMTFINNLVDYDTQFLSILMYVFIFIAYLMPVKTIQQNLKTNQKNILVILLLSILSYVSVSLLSGILLMLIYANKPIPENSVMDGNLSIFLPWSATYQDRLAYIYSISEDFPTAEYYSNCARRLDPYDGNINMRGAYIKEQLNEPFRAVDIYTLMINNEPLYYMPYALVYRDYLKSAQIAINKGFYPSAIKYLKYAETLFPKLEKVSDKLSSSITAHTVERDEINFSAIIDKNINAALHQDLKGIDLLHLKTTFFSLTSTSN